MKKEFVVGPLDKVGDIAKSDQAQVVVYRQGTKVHTKNVEGPMTVKFDLLRNEVSLVFRMLDGEYLVLQDSKGEAKQGVID